MGLTPNQMNTKAAKERKEWFKRIAKERYAAGRELPEIQDPANEKELNAPHADGSLAPIAVLAKGYQYAQRGSDFIRKLNGRGVYRSVDEQYVKENLPEPKTARFPDADAPENFDPGAKCVTRPRGVAGQIFPYVWEAHHLLPGSAFYYETDDGPVFTEKQYEILLSSPYNINRGHNIIMLPKNALAVPVHKLLQHPSDHPEYTQKVMKDLRGLRKDLQRLIDTERPHKAIKAKLKEQLKNLESGCWDLLVALGRRSVERVASGARYQDEDGIVRYTSKSGTEYTWGAVG